MFQLLNQLRLQINAVEVTIRKLVEENEQLRAKANGLEMLLERERMMKKDEIEFLRRRIRSSSTNNEKGQ